MLDPVIHGINRLAKLYFELVVLPRSEALQAVIDCANLLVDSTDLIGRNILVEVIEAIVQVIPLPALINIDVFLLRSEELS